MLLSLSQLLGVHTVTPAGSQLHQLANRRVAEREAWVQSPEQPTKGRKTPNMTGPGKPRSIHSFDGD